MSNRNKKTRASSNVLIFLPACNEEKTVASVVKEAKKLLPNYDILVIDDGSIDETVSEAEKAGATVLSFPFHMGGTCAILTAYLVAVNNDYDFLVKIDADGQHIVEDIPRILRPVLEDEADISVGSRYLNNNDIEEDSSLKIGGRVFSSFILNHILGDVQITDTTCGFRAWNKKSLKMLLKEYLNNRNISDDSVFWLIETIISKRNNLRMQEIPIKVLPRKFDKSKSFSTFKILMYPIRLFQTFIEAILG